MSDAQEIARLHGDLRLALADRDRLRATLSRLNGLLRRESESLEQALTDNARLSAALWEIRVQLTLSDLDSARAIVEKALAGDPG